jgi:hypothetical protein
MKHCHIGARPLDQADDPLSGDCRGYIVLIEAESGLGPAVETIRQEV